MAQRYKGAMGRNKRKYFTNLQIINILIRINIE